MSQRQLRSNRVDQTASIEGIREQMQVSQAKSIPKTCDRSNYTPCFRCFRDGFFRAWAGERCDGVSRSQKSANGIGRNNGCRDGLEKETNYCDCCLKRAGEWWKVETLGILRCAQDDSRTMRQRQKQIALAGRVPAFPSIASARWMGHPCVCCRLKREFKKRRREGVPLLFSFLFLFFSSSEPSSLAVGKNLVRNGRRR
jgi:hypothetical protein